METHLEETDREVKLGAIDEGVLSAADEAKLELIPKDVPGNIADEEAAAEVALGGEADELLSENDVEAPRADEKMLVKNCVADAIAEEELAEVGAMANGAEDTVLEVHVPTLTSEEDAPVDDGTLLGSVRPCEEDPVLDTTGRMPTAGKEVEDGALLEEEAEITVVLLWDDAIIDAIDDSTLFEEDAGAVVLLLGTAEGVTDEVDNSMLLTEEEAEEREELDGIEDGAAGVEIVRGVVLICEEIAAGTEVEVVVVD